MPNRERRRGRAKFSIDYIAPPSGESPEDITRYRTVNTEIIIIINVFESLH